MLCDKPGLSNGTTNNPPNSPTPAAGKTLINSLAPLTVLIINKAVSTTGSNSRTSLIKLLPVATASVTVAACVLCSKLINELASAATNCTKTSPRQRLKKTSVALTRRTIKSSSGTTTMAPKISVGVTP